MKLFDIENSKITISSAFARQRFYCSMEYCSGVCHGGCCRGPSVVLLTNDDIVNLKSFDSSLSITGKVLKVTGKMCPLAFPNGLCMLHDNGLKPFVCATMPFCLNSSNKLILDNGFMKRACRVRAGVEGGLPAYKSFKRALTLIFGEVNVELLTKHFDNGGGDITLPVSDKVMESLLWHREVVNSIKKFGYNDTIEKLSEE